MKKVTIISPHPDDLEFGCAGFIRENPSLKYQCLLGCTLISYQRGEKHIHVGSRLKEQQESLSSLSVFEDSIFFKQLNLFFENNPNTVDYSKAVDRISRNISDFDSDVVFIPLPSFNQDHRLIFDLCMTAFRPLCLSNVKKIYAYEYPAQAGWDAYFDQKWGKVYCPLSEDSFKTKMTAIAKYDSQLSGRGHTIYGIGGVETLAMMRGHECGHKYAEMFYLIREIL